MAVSEKRQAAFLRDYPDGKKCADCNLTFPLEGFVYGGKLRGPCIDCYKIQSAAKMRESYRANPEKFRAAKKVSYNADPEAIRSIRRQTYAQDPDKVLDAQKAAYARDPAAVRKRRMMKIYNLTEIELNELLAQTECPICGEPPEHIDHCHRTGLVRARLCSSCNKGLGFFGDDPERLVKAAAYLRSFEKELVR